jgi:LmbE family N-acetylglucosaminyl deacetylase
MGRYLPPLEGSLAAARGHALGALQAFTFGRTSPTVGFDSGGPVLLLSPHLDDAVLNCCSVLMSDEDVCVVNVFAGIPGAGFVSDWDRACGARESAEHVRRRIAEDKEVLAALGRRPVNLPFLDIQYGLRRLSMKALDRAVARCVPIASLAYAPAALGEGHVDHRLVRSYARALARAGVPVRLYADVPYAVRAGWPAWVREGRSAEGADQRNPRPSRKTTGVHVVTLEPVAAARKLQAMQAYASQFSALDEDGRLTDPATHRHEVFWSLAAGAEAARPGP